jgi:hypothetical protein
MISAALAEHADRPDALVPDGSPDGRTAECPAGRVRS